MSFFTLCEKPMTKEVDISELEYDLEDRNLNVKVKFNVFYNTCLNVIWVHMKYKSDYFITEYVLRYNKVEQPWRYVMDSYKYYSKD